MSVLRVSPEAVEQSGGQVAGSASGIPEMWVTSNEGAGYIPAGVHVPRAMPLAAGLDSDFDARWFGWSNPAETQVQTGCGKAFFNKMQVTRAGPTPTTLSPSKQAVLAIRRRDETLGGSWSRSCCEQRGRCCPQTSTGRSSKTFGTVRAPRRIETKPVPRAPRGRAVGSASEAGGSRLERLPRPGGRPLLKRVHLPPRGRTRARGTKLEREARISEAGHEVRTQFSVSAA